MAYSTAIAYCIMLILTPGPNIGIVTYINKKPLLTKVVLDYHHRDMILINWAMSCILISSLIFLNQPGYHEYYSEYTKYVFDHFVRKGVGLFFIGLMNCFMITAVIHYIQKFHWTWLCEQDDQVLMKLFRSSNAASTIFVWISYIISPHYIINSLSVKMSIIQLYSAICLTIFVVIHMAIAIRKYIQNRQIKATYKHVHLDSDLDKIWISIKESVLTFTSISVACTVCVTFAVMFHIDSQYPRSIASKTFAFTFAVSLVCPTIFIMGNKKMKRYIKNSSLEFIDIRSTPRRKVMLNWKVKWKKNSVGIASPIYDIP